MTTHIVMLAYNKAQVVEDAIERLLKTNPDTSKYYFILVDPEYPLNPANSIEYIWEKHRHKFNAASFFKIKNEGVAQNYNQVIFHFAFQPDDFVHFFDPDNAPRDVGYLDAMIDVLQNPEVAYVTLERPDPDIPYNDIKEINGHKCAVIYRGHSWPMGAFRADFLNEAYPIKQDNGAWGFIEDWLYREFLRQNRIGVFLLGYVDEMIDGTGQGTGGQDDFYLQYQVECANRRTQETFETWLKKKMGLN